ncbi:MAG: helix-turn-helix domain-containing protein [Acidimicrobiia bacterium]
MAASSTELARTLRERRRALGLTRTRLADRSGIPAVDLGRWERGEAVPNPDQIALLADAVGLDDEETQAWLDAAITVDLTDPEIAVELIEPSGPRANPFSQRLTPLQVDASRLERMRARVGEFGRNVPSPIAAVERLAKLASPRPALSARTGLVAQPVGRPDRELPSVFPDTQVGSFDPAVRVYSTAPSTYPSPDDEQMYLLRRIRTASVLLGLGIILWWAFGALGEGVGDVFDLFRAPGEASPIP